jgi:hypothetical protein
MCHFNRSDLSPILKVFINRLPILAGMPLFRAEIFADPKIPLAILYSDPGLTVQLALDLVDGDGARGRLLIIGVLPGFSKARQELNHLSNCLGVIVQIGLKEVAVHEKIEPPQMESKLTPDLCIEGIIQFFNDVFRPIDGNVFVLDIPFHEIFNGII